jgi:TM2 domain-containing membrane protein YozV
MRGEYVEAEDLLCKAIELDDSRLDVRELMADMLYARGQLGTAAEEYKKILDADPKHAFVETKYAKVILEQSEADYEKRMAVEMLTNPQKFAEPPRHPLLAFILSAVVPGLGQLYNKEIVKAAIIVGTILLSALILALCPIETGNLLKGFSTVLNPSIADSKQKLIVGPFVTLAAGVIMFVYIYAIIDAPIAAAKDAKPKTASNAEMEDAKRLESLKAALTEVVNDAKAKSAESKPVEEKKAGSEEPDTNA